MRRGAQNGQALVELVALLPALVLLGLIGWQMVVAGYAWTLAGGAARAGARAAEVGAPARQAALAALPSAYADDAEVGTDAAGRGIRVRLRVPRVVPVMPLIEHVVADAGSRP